MTCLRFTLPLSRQAAGFTLSELLIALGILAVIATFTIPKVLQSEQDQKKKAIFKETIAAIQEMVYLGVLDGSISGNFSNLGNYFPDHINAIKICSTNSSTQGCWDTATQGAGGETNEPGFVLSNSATVTGINNTASIANGFKIDWNGTQGPNSFGDDQLYLSIFMANSTGFCYSTNYTGKLTSVCPSSSGNAANATLFDQIFQ